MLRVCYPTHQEVRFVAPKDFWFKKAKSFMPVMLLGPLMRGASIFCNH